MAMYKSPATRRYLIRMAALMSVYILLIFAAGWTFRHTAIAGIPAYALAIAPALPIIGVFWAVMRLLVEEPDEYIRTMNVRQTLVATVFMLCATTIWGFLESFDLVSHVEVYWVSVLWFGGLGLGNFANRLTMGRGR